MTTFPKTAFPSIAQDTECEPIHSLVCAAAGFNPADSEVGVLAVDLDEAIDAQNFPADAAGEVNETDHETAGAYFFVSNSSDGYGALVHLDRHDVALTCWRRP